MSGFPEWASEAVKLGVGLGRMAIELISAAHDRDLARVEKILPTELRLTLARHLAEAKADEKFGAP